MLPPERKLFLVTVTRTTVVRLRVLAESRRDAEDAVEDADAHHWAEDYDESSYDACEDFKSTRPADHIVVEGTLYEADSPESLDALAAEAIHPRDDLTLPLFSERR